MSSHLDIQRVGAPTEHVAHKTHRCTICGHAIQPGTPYGRETWRNLDAIDARHCIGVAKYHLPNCDAKWIVGDVR